MTEIVDLDPTRPSVIRTVGGKFDFTISNVLAQEAGGVDFGALWRGFHDALVSSWLIFSTRVIRSTAAIAWASVKSSGSSGLPGGQPEDRY
jgi:hypothetical protein